MTSVMPEVSSRTFGLEFHHCFHYQRQAVHHLRMKCALQVKLQELFCCPDLFRNSCRHIPRDQAKLKDSTSCREVLYSIYSFLDVNFVGQALVKTTEFLFLAFLLGLE